MKHLFLSLLFVIGYAISSLVNAQSSKITTESIKVSGVCSSCKKRIENAAYIKGVKKATWDAKSQQLQVIYQSDKTNRATIADAVLKTGHDADGKVANDNNYKSLPPCCAYKEEGAHVH